MAREHSYKKPAFESALDEPLREETLNIPKTDISDIENDTRSDIGKAFGRDDIPQYKERKIELIKPEKIVSTDKVTRTYSIDANIADILTEVSKRKNGGKKGTLSAIVQNGIIRELMHEGRISKEHKDMIQPW